MTVHSSMFLLNVLFSCTENITEFLIFPNPGALGKKFRGRPLTRRDATQMDVRTMNFSMYHKNATLRRYESKQRR